MRISIAGVLPYFAFVVLRQSLQAMHRVAPIVWTMVVANLTNAALNWVFVYGHLGSPALGVAGSAIATAISRWLMTLLLLVLAWSELRPTLVPIRVRQLAVARRSRACCGIGMPIGAQQALEAGAFGAIGLLMGVIGTVAMAAHQIAITLAALTFMVPLGVATAAAVRVGHAIGAGDDARARAAVRAAYICGVGFMTITAAVFLSMPHPVRAAFTRDAEVVALAALLIPIAGDFSGVRRSAGGGRGRAARRGRHDGAALRDARRRTGSSACPSAPSSAFARAWARRDCGGDSSSSLAAVAVFLLLRIRTVFSRELRRVHVEHRARRFGEQLRPASSKCVDSLAPRARSASSPIAGHECKRNARRDNGVDERAAASRRACARGRAHRRRSTECRCSQSR